MGIDAQYGLMVIGDDALSTAQKPHVNPIRLDTPDYIVRTIDLTDDLGDWAEWLTDTDTARSLNARADRLSKDALEAYIASFDGETSYLFGIFEKQTGRLVGVRAIYIDALQKAFYVNVLIGERDARDKGARTQSRHVVYQYFFETRGLEVAYANVVATNEAVLAGMAKRGWLLERTSRKADANGAGAVELHHFRLPRDRWRELQGMHR